MPLARVDLASRDGKPWLTFTMTGEFPADTPPPTPPPTELAFIGRDTVIALDEPMKGNKGEFLRDAAGNTTWFRFGGRLFRRGE